MNRNRFIIPATKIKRRCICRQCGQDLYDPEFDRDSRYNDSPTADHEDAQSEHVYPHPDTWEP